VTRNASIDLVRITGVLAIVAGHIWGEPTVHNLLFAWHVPVFFFLSGYLSVRPRTFKEEVFRRAQTLLKPYLFWFAILYAIWAMTLFTSGGGEIKQWLYPLYGGAVAVRPFTTFWFVFVLFASAVLWRFVVPLGWAVQVALVSLGLVLSVGLGPFLARTPLAIGSAPSAVVFLAAGYLARRIEPATRRQNLLLGAALFVGGIALPLLRITAPLNIKQGDWGTPIASIVVAVALSWGLVLLASAVRLSEGLGRWITRWALTGFVIVLVHPAILWLAKSAGWGPVLTFLFAVMIPTVIGLAALRTPASQWMTGVSIASGIRPELGQLTAPSD